MAAYTVPSLTTLRMPVQQMASAGGRGRHPGRLARVEGGGRPHRKVHQTCRRPGPALPADPRRARNPRQPARNPPTSSPSRRPKGRRLRRVWRQPIDSGEGMDPGGHRDEDRNPSPSHPGVAAARSAAHQEEEWAGTRSASTSGPSPDGRSSWTSPTAASLRPPVHPYANGVIDERLPLPDRDVIAAARLGAAGSRRLPRTSSRRPSRRCSRDGGRRSGGRHRPRHRLHRLHDAAGQGRRHAALRTARASAPSRTPGSSSGSTTPRSRRPTASTRSPARRAGLARPLRRQDLAPSGSSPRPSRSSTRRRRSMPPPTG